MFFVFLFWIDWYLVFFFFFSSRRRHTRFKCDWSSDVCSSDLRLSDAQATSPTVVIGMLPVPTFRDTAGERSLAATAADEPPQRKRGIVSRIGCDTGTFAVENPLRAIKDIFL